MATWIYDTLLKRVASDEDRSLVRERLAFLEYK